VLLSDAAEIDVPALGQLAVDMYLPGDTWASQSPATGLRGAWTTSYISPGGDHVGVQQFPVEATLQSWLFLARVEVIAPVDTPVIVTLGDSISEGYGSTTDTNSRWPDILASRLVETYGEKAPAVLNVAISGNRVLRGNDGAFQATVSDATEPPNPNAGFGPSALERFDRDVLLQPGVTHVVVLESINDIGMTSDPASPTVEELIAGHRALIQRARAHGLTIYAGTLTPFEGAMYFTEEGEAKRQAVNAWIRTGGEYDSVIDFDAIVRDSNNPRRFLPTYHPGDWLHPNDEGYRAMGEAVDLTLFKSQR
jgi:lysophospholipase L1-like esterase